MIFFAPFVFASEVAPRQKTLFIGHALVDLMFQADKQFMTDTFNLNLENKEVFSYSDAESDENVKEVYAYLEAQLMSASNLVKKVAGGSAADSARIGATLNNLMGRSENLEITFLGSIGDDQLGKDFEASLNAAGVKTQLQVVPGMATGKIAYAYFKDEVTRKNSRMLLTSLNAANHFDDSVITEDFLNQFDSFYVEGYVIEQAFDALVRIGDHCITHNKQFIVSLPDAYVVENVLSLQLPAIIALATVVLGRENEYMALTTIGMAQGSSLDSVVSELNTYGTRRPLNQRKILVIQNDKKYYFSDQRINIIEPYWDVKPQTFKDLSGTSFAFYGNFITSYLQNFGIYQAVKHGAEAAAFVLQNIGCTLPEDEASIVEQSENIIPNYTSDDEIFDADALNL
jgi:sugar/nucleoside kinase (ribokinase family)